MIGPLAGLALYEALGQQIRPLLVAAVVPALASALLVLAVKESPRPLLDRRALLPRGAGATASAVRRLVRPPAGTGPGFRRVAAVLVGFGFVDVPDALLLLHLNQVGFGVAAVILAYVGYNAVYALASYPAGRPGRPTGPAARVRGSGLVFFAVAYVGLGADRVRKADCPGCCSPCTGSSRRFTDKTWARRG